jgi:hypothetical protein
MINSIIIWRGRRKRESRWCEWCEREKKIKSRDKWKMSAYQGSLPSSTLYALHGISIRIPIKTLASDTCSCVVVNRTPLRKWIFSFSLAPVRISSSRFNQHQDHFRQCCPVNNHCRSAQASQVDSTLQSRSSRYNIVPSEC